MHNPRIGQKVRKIREAQGFSQIQMAQKLHMCQQGYSCYETNVVQIPLHKFLQLCAIFGMSSDELLAVETPEVSRSVAS